MNPGLLLITHNDIGEQMLQTATRTIGRCSTETRVLRVTNDSDPDQLLERARRCVREVDKGAGTLILTDCFGSTPSNIASRLLDEGNVQVLSGLSLPMLIKVLNYSKLPLPELANKAVVGGCEGIVMSTPRKDRAET